MGQSFMNFAVVVFKLYSIENIKKVFKLTKYTQPWERMHLIQLV